MVNKSNVVYWSNVQRYYGNNPELFRAFRKRLKDGKCPFCSPIENQLVGETDHWRVVLNPFADKSKTQLYLFILPKCHITNPLKLTPEECSDFNGAIEVAIKKYPFMANGYGLCLRVGPVGGITIWHLHWHVVVPQADANGTIPFYFGIG